MMSTFLNQKKQNMKPFYLSLLSIRCQKNIFVLASFLFVFATSQGQVYYGTLSGAIEVPANNSAGVGKTVITINGNLMQVHITFSGLTGTTTASHIHAPTAVPLSPT